MNEIKIVKQKGGLGYAHVYLDRFRKESKSYEHISVDFYKKLVKLDAKLGVIPSEQLLKCLLYTSRLDLIEVRF